MAKSADNSIILEHFEKIADFYDNYKENNNYYYSQSKKLYRALIADSSCSVIELGCGCGDILNFLNPNSGVGIDISPKMIDIALRKYKHKETLRFFAGSIDDMNFMESIFNNSKFDYIIMPDILEHLSSLEKAFYVISYVAHKNAKIIITWANPIWAPLLELLEFLKLKMPEGPHKWPKMKEVVSLLEANNLKLLGKEYSTLIPFRIYIFSDLLNAIACRIPVLKKLCLIQAVVCQKQ